MAYFKSNKFFNKLFNQTVNLHHSIFKFANFNYFTKFNSLYGYSTGLLANNNHKSVNNYKFTFFSFAKMYIRTMRKKLKSKESKHVNLKCRNRSSLRRRLLIVGPSFDRQFVFRRAGYHHKRVKKSTNNKKKTKI